MGDGWDEAIRSSSGFSCLRKDGREAAASCWPAVAAARGDSREGSKRPTSAVQPVSRHG